MKTLQIFYCGELIKEFKVAPNIPRRDCRLLKQDALSEAGVPRRLWFKGSWELV